METIELNISENNSLSFDVEIQGITSEKVDVKFVIESNGMDLSFDGKMEDGVVSVDLPILKEMLKPKTYQSKMVFIVESTKYFEPMHVMVDLVQPVSITATVNETKKTVLKKEDKQVVNENDEITFGKISVTKTKPIMERMEEALPEMVSSSSIDNLLGVYKKEVLLKEDSDVSAKEALEFINAFTKDKFGKSFSEYVKDSK